MHYSIYIPKVSGANPDHLRSVGLGDLLRDNDAGPQFSEILDHGPDGAHGLYLTWPGSEPVYRPGQLTWKAAKPDPSNGLAAGRFWWGINPESPPTADDLIRQATLKGRPIKVADQFWLIPNLLLLPHDFDLDEKGEETRVPQKPYQSIAERCHWCYELIKKQIETGVMEDSKALRRYTLEMLGLNYRLFRDLANSMRLLNDDNWLSVACQTLDFEALVQLESEVLKKRQADKQGVSTRPT